MTGGRCALYFCFTSDFTILVGNLNEQHAANVMWNVTEQFCVFLLSCIVILFYLILRNTFLRFWADKKGVDDTVLTGHAHSTL